MAPNLNKAWAEGSYKNAENSATGRIPASIARRMYARSPAAMLTFTRVTPMDIPRLRRLARRIWHACYPEIISVAQINYMLDEFFSPAALRQDLAAGQIWELAWLRHKPVGFVACVPAPSRRPLKLSKLYLLPACHGRGLGHAMLTRVKAIARRRNARNIFLTVNKRNAKAIRAYLRAGFTVTRSIKVNIGRGFVMDDYVMTWTPRRRPAKPGDRDNGRPRPEGHRPQLHSPTIVKTRHGLRLSQHGAVISELRTTPGPTHSVFDFLSALIVCREQSSPQSPVGRVGVLGFAGGGLMAPLAALVGPSRPLPCIDTCDLDRAGFDLFRRHATQWIRSVRWHHADAVAWLRRQDQRFGLLIEDLSVSAADDVIKPDVSWSILPGLIRSRLQPNGWAVFNLMPPPGGRWQPALGRIAGLFPAARVLILDQFENRILIGARQLPSARALGHALRQLLQNLDSRQATRFRCITLKSQRQPDARAV